MLNARKTARAPVLMARAWVRTPSIERTGAFRALYEAARSAVANSLCLGSGSTAKTQVRLCIRRLSVVAGTAHVRWLWQPASICWAAVIPVIATDAGRALGPMLPASARERWPFFVVRDSCHAALLDQPGLPLIASGRWTSGSRRHPRPLRLAIGRHFIDVVGAGPCHVWVLLPARKSVGRTAPSHP